MKLLLTGGCGDLGKVLAYRLEKRGDTAIRFDIREPTDSYGQYIKGSIFDRQRLTELFSTVDVVVHIAAWHGYHEFTGKMNVYQFWDLNVTGTFNVFQTALEAGLKKIIFISSESVENKNGMYGWTKVLGEDIADRYVSTQGFHVLTLRPRAFIPYWNKEVYSSFVEWAKWFWKGAVHINDVAQAVLQSIDLLTSTSLSKHIILPVDGAYEYTDKDLVNWDQFGPGSTFKKYYAQYYDLAIRYGLDPTMKPTKQNISETQKWLGYAPQYSLKNLLEELSVFGEKGPPLKLD